jgi:hypothetical protein
MRFLRAATVASLLVLAACEDRYRYDCQDPANWQEDICKKPKCVAMGYCTEWLIDTGEEEVVEEG